MVAGRSGTDGPPRGGSERSLRTTAYEQAVGKRRRQRPGTHRQLVLAFVTLTILPTVVRFFAAQKHIISRLTAGAVRGWTEES